MSAPLPQPLVEAFDEVRVATDGLIAAARSGEPDALHAATERRGSAVRRVDEILRRVRSRLDAASEEALAEVADDLVRQASQAEKALEEALALSRQALESLGKAAGAIRSYAAAPSESVFDRSR